MSAATDGEHADGDALVDHHDTEKHAQDEEEEAVDVVLDRVADRHAEGEEQHTADREEADAEEEISDDLHQSVTIQSAIVAEHEVSSQRGRERKATHPTVIERAKDKHKLRDNVDGRADEREEEVGDEEADRLGVTEAGDVLERRDRDKE